MKEPKRFVKVSREGSSILVVFDLSPSYPSTMYHLNEQEARELLVGLHTALHSTPAPAHMVAPKEFKCQTM